MRYAYNKECNICGSKERKIIYRYDCQNLVQCDKCKLSYLDKQRVDLEKLYDSGYYSTNTDNTVANYVDYRVQEKITPKNFKFAYDYLKKDASREKKKLLEIGAGFGYFLKYLPRNIACEAVEISKEAVTSIKKQDGIIVHQGDFLTIKILGKFDFIISFDVIEHQIYLDRYLKKINFLLKKDGIFILTTPDFSSLFNKIVGKNSPLIQLRYHNYYLDKKWLRANVLNFGFRIVSLKTVYIKDVDIGYIILMASFIFPIISRIGLLRIVTRCKINNIVIPFIKFGEIECVLQKIWKI